MLVRHTLRGRRWRSEEAALRSLARRLRAKGVGPGAHVVFEGNVPRTLLDLTTLVDVAGLLEVRALTLPPPWYGPSKRSVEARARRWNVHITWKGSHDE